MSIGYSVEGATDRAFLEGLRQRWCSDAVLIEGSFRGASGISLRRDIPRICRELGHKGANVIVFLTDANEQDWRRVKRRESEYVPVEFGHVTLYGVADRNIECWMAADRDYLTQRLNIAAETLDVPDPKGVIERALGVTSYDRKEKVIASIVRESPIRNWLRRSPSFEAFYEDARTLGIREKYPIPNERERA
ncbi:MAG: hypothetical protein U9R15_11310 [Chloroflexota bacterium]|nr:hypothetical protein [Chloroflexota bacterium]